MSSHTLTLWIFIVNLFESLRKHRWHYNKEANTCSLCHRNRYTRVQRLGEEKRKLGSATPAWFVLETVIKTRKTNTLERCQMCPTKLQKLRDNKRQNDNFIHIGKDYSSSSASCSAIIMFRSCRRAEAENNCLIPCSTTKMRAQKQQRNICGVCSQTMSSTIATPRLN